MSNAEFATKHWPEELTVHKADKTLEVKFTDGTTYTYPAEYLRVESPSAEVQGHSADEKITLGGKRNVGIVDLQAVGNYAVQIVFDDFHDSGLFTWDYLYTLGRDHDTIWGAYLSELEKQGLSRDPE